MRTWGKPVPKQPVEVPVVPVQEAAKPKKTTKKKASTEE